MASHSFYLGPSRAAVQIGTWNQLCAAADSGVLQETQWVECKQDIPRGERANLELAKDLASCSVDGGVLVVGAIDKIRDAGGLVGVEDPDRLRERIGQVAVGRIHPPLNLIIDVLRDDRVAAAPACLLVTVPASADAPHMVDERYWGRSATGKRPLADPEVRRLLAARTGRVADFEHQLVAMSDTFDPISEDQRRFGHVYLYLRPVVSPPIAAIAEVHGKHPSQWIMEHLPGQPQFEPSFTLLEHNVPHPDGLMVSSVRAETPIGDGERLAIQLLLGDDGAVRVTSCHGTRTWDGKMCISPNYHLELAHQTVAVAAGVMASTVGYHGMWDVGVRATGLRGLRSTFAMPEENYKYSDLPFQTENYLNVINASADEMLHKPAKVVERLYGRFTRGLGLDDVLLPYESFEVIGQRIPRSR